MISMSKSLQKQMKHFGSDTRQFQMLKNWSKNSNMKQVVLFDTARLTKGLSDPKQKYSIYHFKKWWRNCAWWRVVIRLVNALRTIQNALGIQLVLSWKVLHWSQRQKITSFARIGLKICSGKKFYETNFKLKIRQWWYLNCNIQTGWI